MKTWLTPVILSPAELDAVTIAARMERTSVGEYIARTSLAEALLELQRRPSGFEARQRKRAERLARGPLPPEI